MKKIAFIALFSALLLTCCTKEQRALEVTPKSISVYADETMQLTTKNVEGRCKYTSSDDYYATVSATGLVTGKKVGETVIEVSSSGRLVKVPITIMHRYSLYPDVDDLVGATVSDVFKVMGGSDYESSVSSSGEMTYLFRNPTSYVDAVMFLMKGSFVETIGVLVSTANTSMITKHLRERYTVAGMQNDMYFFLNHGQRVVIAIQVYSSKYILVMYMKYTASKSNNYVDLPEFNVSEFGY